VSSEEKTSLGCDHCVKNSRGGISETKMLRGLRIFVTNGDMIEEGATFCVWLDVSAISMQKLLFGVVLLIDDKYSKLSRNITYCPYDGKANYYNMHRTEPCENHTFLPP